MSSAKKKDIIDIRKDAHKRNIKRLRKCLEEYRGHQRLGQLLYNSLRGRGSNDEFVGYQLFIMEDEDLINAVEKFTNRARSQKIIG